MIEQTIVVHEVGAVSVSRSALMEKIRAALISVNNRDAIVSFVASDAHSCLYKTPIPYMVVTGTNEKDVRTLARALKDLKVSMPIQLQVALDFI